MRFKKLVAISINVLFFYFINGAFENYQLQKEEEKIDTRLSNFYFQETKLEKEYLIYVEKKFNQMPDFYRVIDNSKLLKNFFTVIDVQSHLVEKGRHESEDVIQKISLKLLHEGELPGIINMLQNPIKGFSIIDHCKISKNLDHISLENLNMECLIRWKAWELV